MKLSRGSVVLVDLDPTVGHEQKGTRPCVVASDLEVAEDQRYPLIAVIPLSGTAGSGVLYPRLVPGPSGLRKASWALIDQLRSVDKRRVVRVYGQLTPAELDTLDAGLRLFLCLPAAT